MRMIGRGARRWGVYLVHAPPALPQHQHPAGKTILKDICKNTCKGTDTYKDPHEI